MEALVRLIRRLVAEEEGQDLVEYAMLVGLIAIVAGVGVTLAGDAVSSGFSDLATEIGTWI